MQAKHELWNTSNIMSHLLVPNSKGLRMCLEKEENQAQMAFRIGYESDKKEYILSKIWVNCVGLIYYSC